MGAVIDGGGAHPDLGAHDALGLATQAELDSHTAALAAHGEAYGTKSGDQSWTSDVTLADVTGMVQVIGANQTYDVEFVAYCDGATSGDLKVAVTVPVGATLTAQVQGPITSATAAPANQTTDTVTASGTASNVGTIGAGTTVCVVVQAHVVNGANAGNIQLQAAQQVSDPTASRVLSGSYFKAERLA